jgi:hypothetical protein
MKSNGMARTTIYQRTRTVFAIALTALTLSSAHTEASTSIDNRGSIGIAPAVAAVGTPRVVTVSAVWPNACPPTLDSVAMEPGINPINLIVRFNVPATLVACAQVETPFAATVAFTPTRDGDVTVVAITNDERVIAKGRMLTLPANAPGSDNLSGMWLGTYASSILMLTHSAGASDSLVGSWNMFARDGTARWQFIINSRRTASNVFEASLNDFSVPANSEACGNSACPVRGLTGRDAGTLKFVIDKNDEMTVEVFSTPGSHPQLPAGTALFKTSLTRLKI